MNLAHDLATLIGGTVRDKTLIVIPTDTGAHVIDCRPTGRVVLDGRHTLGYISDGVELLAAAYHGATVEVCS